MGFASLNDKAMAADAIGIRRFKSNLCLSGLSLLSLLLTTAE